MWADSAARRGGYSKEMSYIYLAGGGVVLQAEELPCGRQNVEVRERICGG
jgi:hypothetical protein